MTIVSMSQADAILNAVFLKARELKLRPISAVVAEPGAIPKAYKKEDGSAMLRFEMAMGKAYAALALGRSTSLIVERAHERPLFMSFMFKASEDKIFAEGGGMLIRDKSGEVIGALGVTGDTAANDELLCAYAIRAAGLLTDHDAAALGVEVRLTNI
jgi:uncharacterized protein GlcG (DUF336 family)